MLRRGAVAPVRRALTRVLPPELAITVTDLNPAMLDWAKSHSGLGRVRRRQMRLRLRCRLEIGCLTA
jgi:hypothetical protein